MTLLSEAIKNLENKELVIEGKDEQAIAKDAYKAIDRIYDQIDNMIDRLEKLEFDIRGAGKALEKGRPIMKKVGLGNDLEQAIARIEPTEDFVIDAREQLDKTLRELEDFMPGLEMQARGE